MAKNNNSREAVAFVICVMIFSSFSLILINPALVLAATYHNSSREAMNNQLMTPHMRTQGGDFTAQATLSLTRATQTNNIVDTRSYYDIWFRTSSSGVIKTIELDFPEGTYIGEALLVQALGIGPGQISRDNADETITYTVTNPVNIPANTNIRIQLSNINNPTVPSDSLTVLITTKNSAGSIIDGPTPTRQYLIKQAA